MAFIKKILWVLPVLAVRAAEACPACLTSDNSGSAGSRVIMIAVMGLFPLAVAVAIGVKIYKICRSIRRT